MSDRSHRPIRVTAAGSRPVKISDVQMANDQTQNSRLRPLKPLTDIGGRAAAATLRPLTGAVGAAADAGISLEQRALDRLLESGELERLLASARLQAIGAQVLNSEGAARLINTFFDSGLFDRLVDRLLASDGLWRLIDEVAASPAVRAAVSQQGLGFADQLGESVRTRSRKGDRRLERAADRLIGRHPTESRHIPTQGDDDGQPTHIS
jgi:hypothetical protein